MGEGMQISLDKLLMKVGSLTLVNEELVAQLNGYKQENVLLKAKIVELTTPQVPPEAPAL